MNPRQRISVAMCTYNGSRFLPEQLASIASQNRLPDEMVVCDDGSTDSTPEIIEDFARSVPFPVRFVRNPQNLGSTKNFEQAIGLCTGDLIALCDQDDVWLPEKLARQAEILERDPTLGGVFSDAELVDEASQLVDGRLWATFEFTRARQKGFRQGQAASVLLGGSVVTGATLMFRSAFREVFEPIPTIWVHDGWIAWMIVLHSKLAPLERPLVRYRLHGNQQVGVGGMTPYSGLPLRQRFAAGRREEPAKYLSLARELQEVRLRADALNNSRAARIACAIQKKIDFLGERGSPYRSRWSRLWWILRSMRDYRQFDRGTKCWLRDMAMLYL